MKRHNKYVQKKQNQPKLNGITIYTKMNAIGRNTSIKLSKSLFAKNHTEQALELNIYSIKNFNLK